jgi:hypothetical protein
MIIFEPRAPVSGSFPPAAHMIVVKTSEFGRVLLPTLSLYYIREVPHRMIGIYSIPFHRIPILNMSIHHMFVWLVTNRVKSNLGHIKENKVFRIIISWVGWFQW